MAQFTRCIQHLGYAHRTRGDGWALVGQDGGQSIDLGDSSLFVFSDTLLARAETDTEPFPANFNRDNARFLANCAAVSKQRDFVQAHNTLEYYSQGWPCEILPCTPAERLSGQRFWPEHGLLLNGSVYLFYIGVRQFDPASTWGFQGTGSGIARFDPRTGECERLRSSGSWRFWPVNWDDCHCGVQVLREGDIVYVFLSRRRGPFSYAMLARVPITGLSDINQYEYLKSDEPYWSARFEDSCDLTVAANEFSVSFNCYLERYLMTYVDPYSKQLSLKTAQFPWGPYTEAEVSTVLPHRQSSGIVSLGFEHPQFAQDRGKTVFISYCQPNFTQNFLLAVSFV